MEGHFFFPVQSSSCVDRDHFYQDMYQVFGNPIGSNINSKVISDIRCVACFEYLIQVERRDLSSRNCGRIVQKLKDMGYNVNKLTDQHDQQSIDFQDLPKDIRTELKRFYEMKKVNTHACHLLQTNDDQKYPGGVRTQRIWGRQTKDLIGKGKKQRFFIEPLPQPLGSKQEYRFISFKDPHRHVIVPPSTWFDVLTAMHLLHGHKGRDTMFSLARKKYFNIPKHAIERFALLCDIRNINKARKCKAPNFSMGSNIETVDQDFTPSDEKEESYTLHKRPFLSRTYFFVISNQYTQQVEMDALCLIDIDTDFTKLFPLKEKTVDFVRSQISEFMRSFGGIQVIHWSDEIDSRFAIAVIETLNEMWEYPVVLGDPLSSSPESKSIEHAITAYMKDFVAYHQSMELDINIKTWSSFLDSAALAMNCKIRKNGLSPYEEVFGRPPNLSSLIPNLSHGSMKKIRATSCLHERDIKVETKIPKSPGLGTSTQTLRLTDLLNNDDTSD